MKNVRSERLKSIKFKDLDVGEIFYHPEHDICIRCDVGIPNRLNAVCLTDGIGICFQDDDIVYFLNSCFLYN